MRLFGPALLALGADFAALASPAGAEPPTAEEALSRQQSGLRSTVLPACPRDQAEEIVVCARRDPEKDRLPLRGERMAGARTRLLPGEPPTGAQALRETEDECSNVGPRPRCGFSISFIQVGLVALKVAQHVIAPETDPPPPPLPSDPYAKPD